MNARHLLETYQTSAQLTLNPYDPRYIRLSKPSSFPTYHGDSTS